MTPSQRIARGTERRAFRRLIAEPSSGATPSARMPGLDALRSASMVAVVAAHAAYAYTTCRIAGLPWAVADGSRAYGYDLLTWAAISWAMPTFFTLGGMAAAALWSSRGPRGFVRDRLRRIVIPALVALPTVLLPSLLVWCLGWITSGRSNFRQFWKMVFVDREIRENRIGPAHLWFLEYLILMLAVFVAIRLVSRRPPRTAPAWAFSALGPLLLAIPTALILWAGHAVNRLDPIVDMRNSFLPNPIRWAHHAWFFAVGTTLYGARGELARLVRLAPTFLVLALPAFAIRATLLRADLDAKLGTPADLALVGSAALYGWLTVLGSIGLALRLFDHATPTVRYMADASYWIYLTHFPVVGLAQVGMYGRSWPPGVKFAIAMAITMGVGLGSYQALVRHTPIGRWLHGPRARRDRAAPAGV